MLGKRPQAGLCKNIETYLQNNKNQEIKANNSIGKSGEQEGVKRQKLMKE